MPPAIEVLLSNPGHCPSCRDPTTADQQARTLLCSQCCTAHTTDKGLGRTKIPGAAFAARRGPRYANTMDRRILSLLRQSGTGRQALGAPFALFDDKSGVRDRLVSTSRQGRAQPTPTGRLSELWFIKCRCRPKSNQDTSHWSRNGALLEL